MVTRDFTLHLRVRDLTTWFRRCVRMAFGHFLLGSQLHGHGLWLLCIVALNITNAMAMSSRPWQTLSPPYELWGVSNPGEGSHPAKILPPPGIFWNPTKNWCLPRPTSNKILPLHSWRPLDYKSHIECTSPSRSQIQYIHIYMCALPPSK